MTDTRIHPVDSDAAKARAVAEYRRDGYTLLTETGRTATLERASSGSLLTHLVLFFTIGWATLGLANWWYARRTRRQTHDRVRVQIQTAEPVEATPGPWPGATILPLARPQSGMTDDFGAVAGVLRVVVDG